MWKIRRRNYVDFSTIMGLPGADRLEGIEKVAIPVQDLTRMMQNQRVKRTLYTAEKPSANGNSTIDFQWADLSDFTEVQVNGAVATLDSQLPQVTEERILILAALEVIDTIADYTSAQLVRSNPAAAADAINVIEWGAITTGHIAPTIIGPNMLPMTLAIGEIGGFFRGVGTGITATQQLTMMILSAERGVMSFFPGV